MLNFNVPHLRLRHLSGRPRPRAIIPFASIAVNPYLQPISTHSPRAHLSRVPACRVPACRVPAWQTAAKPDKL